MRYQHNFQVNERARIRFHGRNIDLAVKGISGTQRTRSAEVEITESDVTRSLVASYHQGYVQIFEGLYFKVSREKSGSKKVGIELSTQSPDSKYSVKIKNDS